MKVFYKLNQKRRATALKTGKIKMRIYTFTVKHDNGKAKISICQNSTAEAVRILLQIEGMPEGAIVNIKIKEIK